MNKKLQMKIASIFTIFGKKHPLRSRKIKITEKLGVFPVKFLKNNADSFLPIRTGAPGNGRFALPVTTKTKALR